MSQENVDQFMKLIEAFNRFDIPGALRFMDPEIRFEHRVAELQGDFTGLDGVRGLFVDFAEHFETLQIHCPDIRDLGDRVLALGTVHAVGKGSGVETELPFTVVASFRNGWITHFTDFGDKDQALEAAGLQE
jgi:ketosteroid isomerase-like protein